MNILFVVAHPDDEVLGAGATIAKMAGEGHKVAVATMVKQAAARANLSADLSREQQSVMDLLGVSRTFFADFPNIRMNTVAHLELVQFVEKCIGEFGAEALYTHHPSDTNDDHAQTSRAVQAAARLFQRRAGIPTLRQLSYMEVPSSTEWSLDSSALRFTPNSFVEIGKAGVDIKLRALEMYSGVMRPYPHSRSVEALTGLAAYRGAQAGCDYAEAFETAFIRLD